MNLDHFQVTLQKMASRLGRHFPPHLLNVDDLTQEGWIGVLSAERSYEESDFSRVAMRAARNKMVDAIRRFRPVPNTSRGVRKLETLVDIDIDVLYDEFEENLCCREFFQKTPAKKQKILQALIEGYTLRETGAMFNLTEGRICQIRMDMRKRIRAELAA